MKTILGSPDRCGVLCIPVTLQILTVYLVCNPLVLLADLRDLPSSIEWLGFLGRYIWRAVIKDGYDVEGYATTLGTGNEQRPDDEVNPDHVKDNCCTKSL